MCIRDSTRLVLPPPAPWLLPRPDVGVANFPRIVNRTPDAPEGGPFPGAKGS